MRVLVNPTCSPLPIAGRFSLGIKHYLHVHYECPIPFELRSDSCVTLIPHFHPVLQPFYCFLTVHPSALQICAHTHPLPQTLTCTHLCNFAAGTPCVFYDHLYSALSAGERSLDRCVNLALNVLFFCRSW
jgi:hypothetical protein